MARRTIRSGFPTREQILDFIASSDQPAGKREIARAFGLGGADKQALKVLLRDMEDEGLIEGSRGRAFHQAGGVPKVTVLRVVDVDDGGTVWAVPERWESDMPEPRLRVLERKGRGPALGIGDRILARTEQRGNGWAAHPMKKLMKGSELVLGVIHQEGQGFWLRPVEKKEKRELSISDVANAEPGDLVLAEKVGRPPRLTARVSQVLGDPFAPRSFSLIAIHKHGIPHEFPDRVIEEAERIARQDLGPREDLTHIPIVAIDPADARDHDDAVWAAPDGDPANPGGWNAIVAIADVSFYVRPGSALDKEARKRGNSVYFPDRVVPMLPETLSAEICSLKEGEDRAALACHLQVTKEGQLKSWRFTRARVRIAANIAYEDAQAAMDALELLPLRDAGDRARAASGRSRAGRIDAEAALGLLAGALRRAGEESSARARPPRAARDARREGADHFGRAARAARRTPADRGLHDRRQRRRGQGAGGEEGAGHVPRPRAPGPREAGSAQGLSRDLPDRVRARPGGPPLDLQPDHGAGRRGRVPAADHGADPEDPDPGLLFARQCWPFRARARLLRPFHQPDPALCRPRRPPLARPDVRPGRRRGRLRPWK
jgi:hypothetical protein